MTERNFWERPGSRRWCGELRRTISIGKFNNIKEYLASANERPENWFGIVSCCLKRRHFGIWFDSSWRGRWNVLPIIKEFDTLQLYFIINNKKTLHTASWNLFTHLPSLSVRCSWPSTLCHSYMVFRQEHTSPPNTRITIMLWVIQ